MYNLRSFKSNLTIHSTKFTWFWKAPVKLGNIYNLPPLKAKWYCSHDRGSEGLLNQLHCNTLGNTLQRQQWKHSELKAKIHNLNWCLLSWNFSTFVLLFTHIHLFLASLPVLFKHKSLSFVNLSLFLHYISIFWLEHL